MPLSFAPTPYPADVSHVTRVLTAVRRMPYVIWRTTRRTARTTARVFARVIWLDLAGLALLAAAAWTIHITAGLAAAALLCVVAAWRIDKESTGT